ncbi:MAG: M20 family metallopeptidase [Clostridiales bacterium]|nr:M20 family metallopeptidase [Clostridiales bacterium]
MSLSSLIKKIDELHSEYVSVWEDICNIESPTSYKQGVDEVGLYFINLAKKFGWKVEVLEQEVSGNAVCITMNENASGKPVAISGHIDTVHPVGSFGSPAVKIQNDKIYGPGVMDCKGGVVAGILAMHALKECGFDKRPVILLLQTDEENSSRTSNKETVKFMCEKSKNCVAFLNLEGHEGFFEGKACIERKGILKYEFSVLGIETHASYCAKEGANAIKEAAYKIIELEKFKDDEGVTCNVGVIKGGSVVNTVARECKFEVDVRFSNKTQMEWIKEKLKEIADKQFVKGCVTTLKQLSFRTSMELCDKNVDLLNKMNAIFRDNGMAELSAGKRRGGSDAADVSSYGIPCVDSLGVKGERAHSIYEEADLISLSESAKRLALVISNI